MRDPNIKQNLALLQRTREGIRIGLSKARINGTSTPHIQSLEARLKDVELQIAQLRK